MRLVQLYTVTPYDGAELSHRQWPASATTSLPLALLCASLLTAGLAEKFWTLRAALNEELFQCLTEAGEQLDSQACALDQSLQNLSLQNAQRRVAPAAFALKGYSACLRRLPSLYWVSSWFSLKESPCSLH